MLDLRFDCAELLGINRKLDYLGDCFDYRVSENLSVRGRLTGNFATERIAQIWSGQSGLINYQNTFYHIYLNSSYLGTGRLASLEFDKGVDARDKPYSAKIEILRPSNFSGEATGTYYSDLSSYSKFQFLNNFSESLDFLVETTGKYSYNKNLSFSVDSSFTGLYSGYSIESFARSIATEIFADSNYNVLIDQQYPNFINTTDSNRFFRESYDVLHGNFSFSEKFDYQSDLFWIWDYKNGVSYGSDGTSTATEEGTIRPSKINSAANSKIEYSLSGWNAIKTGIYSRCSGLLSQYALANFGGTGSCPISVEPVSKSLSKDLFNGFIDYNYVFSNDVTRNSGYLYDYEQSVSYGKDGYSELTQNGSITSTNPNKGSGFSYIYSMFQTGIKPKVTEKVTGIYSRFLDMVTSGCYSSGTLNQTNSTESFKEFEEKIDYSYSYTDNKQILNSGNVYSLKQVIKDNKPVHIVGYFAIPNTKMLAQKSNQSTIGNFSNQINIVGTTGASVSSLLSVCYDKVQKPSGECWISDYGYSYSPFEKTMDFSISYNYSNYRPFESVTV
jgi:hypothetical protein